MALSLVAAITAPSPARAELERVGPPSSDLRIGGYPAWYQDKTGLALDFCAPLDQAEVDGGWCLLLAGDVSFPEIFPVKFFDEHFYFAANAAAPTTNGSRAMLVMAIEAAFANGPAVPGDQITFARMRLLLNPAPVDGDYRFITPYGEKTIRAAAGEKIFDTEDIGFNCGADFSCTLLGKIGPFLIPSAFPGGPEMPPLTASNPTPDTDPAHFGGAFAPTPYPGTGKAYLADPARIGPVTGSLAGPFVDSTGTTRDHNIFRIEGPPGSGLGVDPATGAVVDWVETTDFSLMGRVMADTLPGRIDVTRASYARTATATKVDVMAKTSPTAQGRLPAQPKPAAVDPLLTFFDQPCGGVIGADGGVNPPYTAPVAAAETQMFGTPTGVHWGQFLAAAPPSGICVKDNTSRDANGNLVPVYFLGKVTDEVKITSATFDPSTGTLAVAATSSDAVSPPALTLGYDGGASVPLVAGVASVQDLVAAPAKVHVFSSRSGAAEALVETGFLGGAPAPAAPVAVNDAYTFLEDAAQQTLDVLANDQNVAGTTVSVAITSAPRLGTATVSGTSVLYRPNANASGADALAYTVTVDGKTSNPANVAITLTPVNDAPVAVNDTFNAIAARAALLNLVANDTDPDGAADLTGVQLAAAPSGTTITNLGNGVVSFTASRSGTFQFRYNAVDSSGTPSANQATVTVNVAAGEQVNVARADYTRSTSRLRVVGQVLPAMSQTVKIEFINSAGAVLALVNPAIATDGLGNFDTGNVTVALPTGAVSVRVTSSIVAVRNQSLSIKP